ncbi:cellulose biosynthesis cyclic di-GMP-binding regulatory protein BcsB [Photobacterium arenosum]|uniref:cellulose biosynthesis cyclic di-GMP-binding regulatory protein BcsB n=1 Tax=Photobacterium arenosum TaxID=2774143 RepID=UPI0035CFFABF
MPVSGRRSARAAGSKLFVQKTRLESDLSVLPAPFFDPRDFGRLTLPVIMGADYDLAEIKAAGVLASHFGALSGWRGSAIFALVRINCQSSMLWCLSLMTINPIFCVTSRMPTGRIYR